MQALLKGNFLNAKSGQTKEGAPYFMISVLSGDETVRVSFEPTKEGHHLCASQSWKLVQSSLR